MQRKRTQTMRAPSPALKKALLISLLAMMVSGPALARSWVDPVSTENRVETSVIKDDTIIMRTDTAFKEVRVTNADIADVVVLTDKSFHVLGKTRGKTNVMLYDAQSRLLDIIDVSVDFDIEGIKQSLFETYPKETINVRKMATGVYLSGSVSSIAVAERALKIAQAYAPDSVTDGLSIRDSHQVQLEVRFVEASRDAIKELGIGILAERAGDFGLVSGGGLVFGNVPKAVASIFGEIGNTTLDANLQALEEDGVIRTLAEPNLVSMSGDTASFLAGGEFPIPVQADEGQIGIEFRQFGVGLAFTPTVLDNGIINLEVAPEVSQIDATNSVRISGVEIPSLRVRRANTTVELRNAQSFAIAGLLQNSQTDTKSQVPWLGDVPILGALFRSSRYERAETELVIIVTPRLVQPVADIDQLATPLDGLRSPGTVEQFLNGKIDGAPHATGPQARAKPVKAPAANIPRPNLAKGEPLSYELRPGTAANTAPKSTPVLSTPVIEGGLSAAYGYSLN